MKKQEKMQLLNRRNALKSIPGHNAPLIEVVDNRRALIENHLGITSYEQNEISIKICNGIIEVLGSSLEILCMSKDRIVIYGDIEEIRFWRNR